MMSEEGRTQGGCARNKRSVRGGTDGKAMNPSSDRAKHVKAFSADWWKEERVARILAECFGEHLISLEVAFCLDGKSEYEVYTGFLLSLGVIHLWVTAGHVINRIGELLKHPEVKIVRAGLVDNYSREDAEAIPVSLEDLPVFSAEPHVDFGVAVLRKGYVDPITANPRFRPLTPIIWHRREEAEPEGYYIAGIPEEWVEVREIGRRGGEVLRKATMGIACVPVERIKRRTGEEPKDFWNHPGAFYGQLLPIHLENGVPLGSIKGMSGGPVFSIERTKDRQFKYYLFGIQSAWLASERIIRAAPIEHVEGVINKLLAQVLEEFGP